MKNQFWGLGILLLASSQVVFAQPTEETVATPTETAPAAAPAPVAVPVAAPAPASESAATLAPQETESEHSTVGVFIEPLLAIFGFYEGDIGVAVHDNVVLGVWGQYFDYELLDVKLSGFGVGLGAQIFPIKEAFKGFYVYPMVKYQQVDFGVSGAGAAGLTYYSPQVTVGYQWNWKPFCLRLGGGMEYTFGEVSANTEAHSASADFKGLGYELDIAIGLAF